MTDRERETLLAARPEEILRLPFHSGEEYGGEEYDYEVESVRHVGDGGVLVRLIMLDDHCRRRKNNRGHFRRSYREVR